MNCVDRYACHEFWLYYIFILIILRFICYRGWLGQSSYVYNSNVRLDVSNIRPDLTNVRPDVIYVRPNVTSSGRMFWMSGRMLQTSGRMFQKSGLENYHQLSNGSRFYDMCVFLFKTCGAWCQLFRIYSCDLLGIFLSFSMNERNRESPFVGNLITDDFEIESIGILWYESVQIRFLRPLDCIILFCFT